MQRCFDGQNPEDLTGIKSYEGQFRQSDDTEAVSATVLTYPLHAYPDARLIHQRIMELGGVRASIFDYLTLRTGLNADVSAEELATELDKQKGHVSRELRALKAKGLAEPVRTEETGSSRKAKTCGYVTGKFFGENKLESK